ncbi:MAG: hypothetical protein Q4C04_02920 [Clostridia bacterium]|nr:hypothetical protein [Clostridia bacterium]
MKRVSFWIWVGIVLVAAALLTGLAKVEINESAQLISLGDVSVYIAVLFSCNIIGLAALIVGSVLGVVFTGVYSYILPILIARALMAIFLMLFRRKFALGWKSAIIGAAITEGIMVAVYFVYEIIFSGLPFGVIASGFFAHVVEGAICGLIGLVLLKLFETKSPEQDGEPLFNTKSKGRQLN